MESIEEQCGLNANFVSEVPDYLKCVICQLVLRKPLQIMKCGHRFCKPCFNRLKSYSETMNSQLLCPIDRDLIDLTKVFEDNGMDRVIGNLTVKCDNDVKGCTWSGDLRNLMDHKGQCTHAVVQEFCKEGQSVFLNDLCQRMLNCESSLADKDKDIAFLKFNLNEVKKTLKEKLSEMDLLNNKNKNMQQELKEVNNKNMEVKQIELRMENMCLKNMLLEEKVKTLENQILVSKKQVEDNLVGVEVIREELTGVKEKMENQQVEIIALNDQTKHIEGVVDNHIMSIAQVNDKFTILNENCREELKELRVLINNDIKNIKDSIKEQPDKIPELSSEVTDMEKTMEKKNNVLKDTKSTGPKELCNEQLTLQLEDMVEVLIQGKLYYGVLKWIGKHWRTPGIMTGIELEDNDLQNCTTGAFFGKKYFHSPQGRAFFTELHNLKPDSRFCESFK